MRTAAILPVKRFSRAKQRLGADVAERLRSDLARAMVGDVLVALHETTSIDQAILITNEESVARAARYQGAIVVQDTLEEGQSTAVTLGIQRALADGLERVLCIPGDCPALDPGELDLLLNRNPSCQPEVVIIPDRHGTGTNGLLLTPPDVIPPSFGPDSRARHSELARLAAVACHIAQPASLLLDIDTGEDLAVLRKRLEAERGRAFRTRTVLGIAHDGSAVASATETSAA